MTEMQAPAEHQAIASVLKADNHLEQGEADKEGGDDCVGYWLLPHAGAEESPDLRFSR